MLKKSDIPNIIKTAVILFLITGISAFILAGANAITAPIIEKNAKLNMERAMQKVMPEADSFLPNTEFTENEDVKEIYSASAANEKVGYIVIAEPMGYNGAISMVIGIDGDGVVTGVDITSQSETPGLGANCTKDEFINQFAGKIEGIKVVKTSPGENEVDAITSATITTKAVTKGVNSALEAVNKIRDKEGKE